MIEWTHSQAEYDRLLRTHFELTSRKCRIEAADPTATLDGEEEYQELLAAIEMTEAQLDGVLARFDVDDYHIAFEECLE